MGKPLKVGRPKTYQYLLTMRDNLLSNTVASVLINGIMNAPLKGEKLLFALKCYALKKFRKILLEYEKYGKVNEIFMPRKDVEENHIAGMGNTYVLFDSVDDIKML